MRLERIIAGVFAFLCVVSASGASGAEINGWKVSASASFETGTYGSSTRTETWYMPVTAKKKVSDDAFFSLTIPVVSQRGDASVASIDGSPFSIKPATGAVTTSSGLGDIILRGGYNLVTESRKVPFDLALTGKIKLPTADDSKGLGTGEFDAGAGLEFAKSLPSGFTGYIDLYYTSIGDPPGLDLDDRVFFDIGFSRALDPYWTLSAFYEESNTLVKSSGNIRDLMVHLEYKADARTRLFFGGTVGLTETSPDYGLTIGASILL